jgi:hypothetical protein
MALPLTPGPSPSRERGEVASSFESQVLSLGCGVLDRRLAVRHTESALQNVEFHLPDYAGGVLCVVAFG